MAPVRSCSRSSVMAYVAGAILPTAIAAAQMKLWAADLRVPLMYCRDALTSALYIKGLVDNGWYTQNQWIGEPGSWSLYAYPNLHTMHFAFIKVMSALTSQWGVLLNGYYLLTFMLAGLAGMFALRELGVHRSFAVAGATLFGLLPYHFMRGVHHLFLSGYYPVAPAVLLAVWAAESRSVHALIRPVGEASHRRLAAFVASCVLVGLSEIYYVVTSVLLLGTAGLSAVMSGRRLRCVLPAVCTAGLVLVVCLVNYVPVLHHRAVHGATIAGQQRTPENVLRGGFELGALFLPPTDHGIAALGKAWRAHEGAHRHPLNGDQIVYVGIMSGAGLLIVALSVLQMGESGRTHGRLRLLFAFAFILVAYGTIGGLGYVFSLFGGSAIRQLNRVSVFLGFIGLAGLLLAIDGRIRLRSGATRRRVAAGIGACGIILAGAIDQTDKLHWDIGIGDPAYYDRVADQFWADAAFGKNLERTLPSGGKVLQLPHFYWPEAPAKYHLGSYEHVRGYLHSTRLRWSFGAIRGKPEDRWLEVASAKQVDDLVVSACLMGFSAIWVDRRGYKDDGEALEAQLGERLGGTALTRQDKHVAVFDLRSYAQALRRRMSASEWDRRSAQEHVVYWEGKRGADWAELTVANLGAAAAECMLTVYTESRDQHRTRLQFNGSLLHEALPIEPGRAWQHRNIVVPPGEHTLRMEWSQPAGSHPAMVRPPKVDLAAIRWRPL